MENKTIYDLAIIGGGIVGVATAYKLQQKYPDKRIVLLEKEDRLADHQTGNNSGVIHSGLYYKPGSAKAKTCVSGRKQLVSFAQEHNVAHDVCGKVVVATEDSEMEFLNKIFNNGIANGTEGIEKIDGKRVQEIEPFCTSAIAGIWVPCTGIIDFRGATEKMAELVISLNSESQILLGKEVKHVDQGESHSKIITSDGHFLAKKNDLLWWPPIRSSGRGRWCGHRHENRWFPR